MDNEDGVFDQIRWHKEEHDNLKIHKIGCRTHPKQNKIKTSRIIIVWSLQ